MQVVMRNMESTLPGLLLHLCTPVLSRTDAICAGGGLQELTELTSSP